MRRSIACAFALSLLAFVRSAGADPLTESQRKALVITDEAGDAWLHDHCSFRGTANPSVRNAAVPGQVVELIDNGQSPIAKEFRCAEQPPFWKGAWSPAPEEAVACREPKPGAVCVPPLRPPPPPPVAPALVPDPEVPAVVAPPPPPPPSKAAPPKRARPPKTAPTARSAKRAAPAPVKSAGNTAIRKLR